MTRTYMKCEKCGTDVEITKELAVFIGEDIHLMCDDLYHALKAMHRNCDPVDMTFEDHLVWEKWNKIFYPENYDNI